jgi:decaprenylphospho-beta-D-erythro-pentofuranosid-2-ulose 2-reductase
MRDALGNVENVLVLGGTSELALAITAALLPGRGHAVLAVRDPQAAHGAMDQLAAAGVPTVDAVSFDARSIETHAAFVEQTFADHGDFDIVIVAFGILGDQTHADHDAAHALDIVATNFDGAVSVLVPIAERMRAQAHGTIIVLSSVAAIRPRRANFVYGASKAGLDAFANGLADQLEGTGVRVLVVRPGFVHTKMTHGVAPAPFATDTETVARVVVRALGGRRTVVYAPPVLDLVAPVLRILPRTLWRRLSG